MMMAVLRLSQAEADSNKIAGFTEKNDTTAASTLKKAVGFASTVKDE